MKNESAPYTFFTSVNDVEGKRKFRAGYYKIKE